MIMQKSQKAKNRPESSEPYSDSAAEDRKKTSCLPVLFTKIIFWLEAHLWGVNVRAGTKNLVFKYAKSVGKSGLNFQRVC